MRPIEPTQTGRPKLEGFQISYETFGDPGAPPILLLPTWQIVHSRHWKMQVPYLARSFYVITYDSAGNGEAERTLDPAAFEFDRVVDQGIGLLDHLHVGRVDLLGFSRGCVYGIWMAARYADRVNRLVLIGNGVSPDSFTQPPPPIFWERRETYDGWQKQNAHFWSTHYREWLEFFFGEFFSEPHSTKGFDDCVSWGLETTPEILVRTTANSALWPKMPAREAIEGVRCRVLILHGQHDRISEIAASHKLAAARPDFELQTLEGCGHGPHVRDPVQINLAIAEFLRIPLSNQRRWPRAMARRRLRALYVSSPIGLGHIQRDLAIARELRRLVPDLDIDWLAVHPVTRVLEQAGETIHPMSRYLFSESTHWEQSAGEHDLNCFLAWREMDEILLANFMVFLDTVREKPYDLWIGDEAWDIDYYLHENPELKTAPFVFLTDFLGWLPIDRSPGSREAFLCADDNAEMIEHVARYPRVRDRALYVGEYEDLIPERFGPDLPFIPDWTRDHFTAVGYITPFDPAEYADTGALRRRLGYRQNQPLVIYAVGGTAVGEHLLGKAIDAWPRIHEQRPDAHCVAVAGPRINAAQFPERPGLEVRGYVHDLFEHLAAADAAVVQGGLTTTMELTLTRRPFVYLPLRNHCEQVYHVAYRLDQYRAGRRMDYSTTTVEMLADAVLESFGTDTSRYRRHDPTSVGRAAASVAELL